MGILNRIFGGSNDPSPKVVALMADMRSEEASVRLAACEALGELGEEAKPATELLESLIQDEDGEVCIAAAAAISKVVRGF